MILEYCYTLISLTIRLKWETHCSLRRKCIWWEQKKIFSDCCSSFSKLMCMYCVTGLSLLQLCQAGMKNVMMRTSDQGSRQNNRNPAMCINSRETASTILGKQILDNYVLHFYLRNQPYCEYWKFRTWCYWTHTDNKTVAMVKLTNIPIHNYILT